MSSAQKLNIGAGNLQGLTAVKCFSSTPTRNDAAKDDSSSQEERIYSGGLTSQIKALKVFSISTSVIGLGVQPLVWTQFLEKYGSGATFATFTMLGFFTAVTPLMIHYIAKKYVTELYFNKKTQTYKAITFSFLLGRVEVRIKFVLFISVNLLRSRYRLFSNKMMLRDLICWECSRPSEWMENHFS